MTDKRLNEQAYRTLKIQCDLSYELGKSTSLMEAMEICVEAAMAATGMELAGIYLVNQGGDLEMFRHRGLPEEFVRAVHFVGRDSVRLKAVLQGNPIYFGAGATPLPKSVGEDGAEYYKSLAVIPFKHRDQVIGCLNIGSCERDEITEVDRRTLETIGSRIGDLIARIRAEEMLKHSEEKFRVVCQSALNAVIMMDDEGKISFWNNAAERTFGYPEAEAVGKDMHSLLVPEKYSGEFQKAFETYRKTGAGNFVGKTIELAAVRKNGEEFPVELTLSAVNLKGKWNSFGIVRDITRRKREEEEKNILQQQLLQAQKMEAIGALAGGVAHDFNNIIATINGTAEILLKTAPPDSPDYSKLQKIIKSGMRAKDLTMKLLTFARKEKLNVGTICLETVVADLTDMLSSAVSKEIRIEVETGESDSHVTVDANQIMQALLNICINACDSMPDGGVLKITIENELHDNVEYRVVSIGDTGAGMDEQTLAKIFEPFFTTKERGKGAGLGLSITHGIIKQHNGFIRVTTAPGIGTTFRVAIPAAERPVPVSAAPPENASDADEKGTALIVDDNRDFIQMIEEALELEGFETIVAHSGAEAVAIYEKNMRKIDVVVLDMILPEMDGTAIFHAIRKMNPSAKVVLCSGYSQDGKVTRLLREGAVAYIQKPFQIFEMVGIISKSIWLSKRDSSTRIADEIG